ncbi:MAG: protein kinase [Gemmatimonadetes bacterium]|nr:protein kinase [Gemmatimonadota bacterium]
MPRFGLSLKIFLSTAAIVTALLVATLVVTSASARASAEHAIDRGLSETNARIAEQLQARQKELAKGIGVWAANPMIVTTVFADTTGNNAYDQSGEAVAASGARWAQIIDTNAVVLARSDDRGAKGGDVSRSPLVVGALGGNAMSGFGVTGDSVIVQLVALPILKNLNSTNSQSVAGVIMGALQVGDSLAKAIGEATGSEVAFYVIDKKGAPHVAGATVAAADRDALQQEVRERMSDTTTTKPRAAGVPDSSKRKKASAMGTTSDRTDLSLGGKAYIGQMTPLLSAAGAPVGGFLSLRSLDAELAPYYSLRKGLLLTGALGLIVAFLLSGAITRQIVRPVQALVGATRRAADGDYAAEIPAHGDDEIGTLAEAVRRLLTDLREKQALVDFLGGGRAMNTATVVGGDSDATQMMQDARAPVGGILAPGQSLGVRYDIKALLGAGGMGMVYRAVDRELQEVVAIKTLKPEMLAQDTTALERFKSEIRLARKISHRNVVRTHDLGEARGLYFITMEFVEGTSLKDLVRQRGRLPVQVMLPIAKQLCRALEVAHDAGVIHRDIKPQNMVVERNGTLKVMDFGIARLASRAPQQGLTAAGMVIGTPDYMSPEQLLGDELDARADIYSAGVVLYECLTGRLPFEATSPIALIAKVLEETPPTPHELFDEIPISLSSIVMRAMAKERDSRPASAELLHDSLESLG